MRIRPFRKSLLIGAALACVAFCVAPATRAQAPAAAPAQAPAAAPKADLILRNAAIYTVDRVRSWAEAVAIKNDKIVYVGSDKGAARYAGPGTRVVDLGGKMVLPGF